VARTNDLSRVLWLVTSTWLVGCGRVGFGDLDRDPGDPLADAPVQIDAAAPIDTPAIDALVIDGPVTPAPAGPKLTVGAVPTMTTTCGGAAPAVIVDVSNDGDQDLVITDLPSDVDGFRVETTSGDTTPLTLPPAKKITLRVTPPQAVIGNDIGGNTKNATLKILSNSTGEPKRDVLLEATIQGANIVVFAPAPPLPLAFSSASGCPGGQTATIQNTGNVRVTVGVLAPPEFAMTGSSSAAVSPLGTLSRSFRPITSSPCSTSAVIEYTVSGGANCGSSSAISASLNATLNIGGGASTCFCS